MRSVELVRNAAADLAGIGRVPVRALPTTADFPSTTPGDGRDGPVADRKPKGVDAS